VRPVIVQLVGAEAVGVALAVQVNPPGVAVTV